MEERRFDDLTRVLGRATSRRGVLKGLLGGLTAALAGRSIRAPGAAAAAAGCSTSQCVHDAIDDLAFYLKTTCHSLCRPQDMAEGGMGACFGCQHSAHLRFSEQVKKCRTGDGCLIAHVCCGDRCTVVQTDPQNCGACGHACAAGVECSHGQCPCPDPQTNCDGQCIDTQSDHENCGSCGHACTGCENCLEGQCTSICGSDGYCCNDHCVDDQCSPPKIFDPSQCGCVCPFGGDCGDTCCTGSQECCQGQCVDPCPSGQPRDPATCQCPCDSGIQCGDTCCADGQECCNGQCVGACPPGQHLDSGTCECACNTGETCGPSCCSSGKACCPDTLSGVSCRDQDPACPNCQYSCGDICCGQYEFCCRAADYSFHCVASSGDTC